MSQRYPIPAAAVRAELTIKRSRFIATLNMAATVDAAKAWIQAIRAEMPDATHHVYAFRIGYGSSVQEGLSDDGEPAGTSGKPVMAIVRGADLGDVVIVVTRYFGGIKLGTGGLVRAYSAVAKEAFARLPITEKVAIRRVQMRLPYANYDAVTRLLPAYQASIIDEQFAADVTVTLCVPSDLLEACCDHLREFSAHNAPLTRFE